MSKSKMQTGISPRTSLTPANVAGEGKLITTFDGVVDFAKKDLEKAVYLGRLEAEKVRPVSVIIRVGDGQLMTSKDKKVQAERVRLVLGAEWSPDILDENGNVAEEGLPAWTAYIPRVYMGDHRAMLRQVILAVVIASVRSAKDFSEKQLAQVRAGTFSVVNVPVKTHAAAMAEVGIECTDVLEHANKGGIVLVDLTERGLKRYKAKLAQVEKNTHTVGRAQVFKEANVTVNLDLTASFESQEDLDAVLAELLEVDSKGKAKIPLGKVIMGLLKAKRAGKGRKLSAVG